MGGGSGDGEVYRFATIKTDKDDYAPGQLAVITGSGWAPLEEVTLTFQEDPAVHEDYVLTLTADDEGNIYHDQWAPEEHDLNVRFYLMAVGEESHRRAQMTFTDSRMITGVTLDGVSIGASGSVTVAAGQSITAVVTVDTTGTNSNARNWGATGWRISTTAPTVPPNNAVYGTVECVDHSNVTTAGTGHQRTFTITAPDTGGMYHAYFIAFQGDACQNDTGTSDESAIFSGTDAVVVDSAVHRATT